MLNNVAVALRTTIVNTIVDAMDVGSANANGKIRIYTAGFATLLAELDFANPAFAAASAGSAAVNTISDETSAPAGGSAAVVRFLDRDEATVCEGTVTATGGGGDITLSSTTISPGDRISITGGNFTMPATPS